MNKKIIYDFEYIECPNCNRKFCRNEIELRTRSYISTNETEEGERSTIPINCPECKKVFRVTFRIAEWIPDIRFESIEWDY